MDRVYTIYKKMHCTQNKVVRKLFEVYLRVIYACDIPAETMIGENCRFPHNVLGVVIHPHSIIGNNCVISQNVTIGGRSNYSQVPVIGDGTLIGANALILGPVKVGANCKIGAGTVVIKDVPDGATIVGNPARIIRE